MRRDLSQSRTLRFCAYAAAPVSQVGILALPHDKDVRSAAFSSDGHRIATISSNIVKVWDAEKGGPLGSPLVHQKDVGFAAFSPDSTQLVTVSSNEARVWNVATGMPLGPTISYRHNLYSAAFFSGLLLVTAQFRWSSGVASPGG